MASCPHCGHALPDRRGTVHAYSGQHLRVIFLLAQAARPLTHEQLIRHWEAKSARAGALSWPFAASSSVRTYTSELARWGLVEVAATTARTIANRPARTWQLTALTAEAANLQLDDFGRSVLHGLVDEAKTGGDLAVLAALGVAA